MIFLYNGAGPFFVWGDGPQFFVPIVAEGPFWAEPHHVHFHRVYPPQIHAIVVAPGRRYADDVTLCTFSSLDMDGDAP